MSIQWAIWLAISILHLCRTNRSKLVCLIQLELLTMKCFFVLLFPALAHHRKSAAIFQESIVHPIIITTVFFINQTMAQCLYNTGPATLLFLVLKTTLLATGIEYYAVNIYNNDLKSRKEDHLKMTVKFYMPILLFCIVGMTLFTIFAMMVKNLLSQNTLLTNNKLKETLALKNDNRDGLITISDR